MDKNEIKRVINEAKDLVKSSGYTQLMDDLTQLGNEYEALISEIDKLIERNEELLKRLGEKKDTAVPIEETIRSDGPPEECYTNVNDDTLFCPSCWKSSRTLNRLMITPPQTSSIGKYRCNACGAKYGERKNRRP